MSTFIRPRVRAYIVTWNEIKMLPHAVEHYREFCESIVVLDHHSTDGTADLARKLGCEVREWGVPGVYDDDHLADLKNNVWRHDTDWDWVVVCDCDELLDIDSYHLDLEQNTIGSTLITGYGMNMHHMTWPERLTDVVRVTDSNPIYSKTLMWRPRSIKRINYGHGAHKCWPEGNVKPSIPYGMLHYKFITGIDYQIERYAACSRRMSQKNKDGNLSNHYHQSAEEIATNYKYYYDNALPIRDFYKGNMLPIIKYGICLEEKS